MEYINHFTLKTGHCRKSFPSEIDKTFLFQFLPEVRNIINAGKCDFYFDTKIEIILEENDYYAATLYTEHDGHFIPVFFTVATSNQVKRKQLIKTAMAFRQVLPLENTFLPPDAPLIIDIVLPTIVSRMELAQITGDMSRCLSWALFDP